MKIKSFLPIAFSLFTLSGCDLYNQSELESISPTTRIMKSNSSMLCKLSEYYNYCNESYSIFNNSDNTLELNGISYQLEKIEDSYKLYCINTDDVVRLVTSNEYNNDEEVILILTSTLTEYSNRDSTLYDCYKFRKGLEKELSSYDSFDFTFSVEGLSMMCMEVTYYNNNYSIPIYCNLKDESFYLNLESIGGEVCTFRLCDFGNPIEMCDAVLTCVMTNIKILG